MDRSPSDRSKTCSGAAQDAWIQLIRAHRRAMGSVERALRAAGLPALEWYDVLWELERAGPLRSRDLQDRLLVAQYNLSRLLDRMEKERLISRERCSEDARCQWLRATPDGKALRKRMWPVYAAAIEEALGARLSVEQADMLSGLLRNVSRARPQP